MNEFFSQLKKDAENLRLSKPEKEAMRERLDVYMREHPLVKSPFTPTPSPYFFFVSPRYVSVLAVLVLVAVGGSAYAAEGSVPGDFLYVVKRGVNEPVRAALATSAEAKASWHAEAAERRMREVVVLSAEGTLTADTKAELESNFDEHAEEVEKTIETVIENDPVLAADISGRFESALAAHSALIARLSRESDEDDNRRNAEDFARRLKEREERLAFAGEASVSVEAVRDEAGTIAVRTFAKQENALSASIEVRDSESAVVERLGKNTATTLEEAEARFESIRAKLPTSTSARLEAQINGIRKQIERSRGDAFSGKRIIERALKDATTIKTFLDAEQQFEGRAILPAIDVAVPDEIAPGHEEEREEELQMVSPLPL